MNYYEELSAREIAIFEANEKANLEKKEKK